MAGDLRWCGAYGMQADFIARSNRAIEVISSEDIKLSLNSWPLPDLRIIIIDKS